MDPTVFGETIYTFTTIIILHVIASDIFREICVIAAAMAKSKVWAE